MAERRNTQPSLLRMMQSRFMSQVKAYNKAKRELDKLQEQADEISPDTAMIKDIEAAERKERLLRGMVRGAAQMLIIVSTPHEAKDNNAINDLEFDSGVLGVKRSKPKAKASDFSHAFLNKYYGRDE